MSIEQSKLFSCSIQIKYRFAKGETKAVEDAIFFMGASHGRFYSSGIYYEPKCESQQLPHHSVLATALMKRAKPTISLRTAGVSISNTILKTYSTVSNESKFLNFAFYFDFRSIQDHHGEIMATLKWHTTTITTTVQWYFDSSTSYPLV